MLIKGGCTCLTSDNKFVPLSLNPDSCNDIVRIDDNKGNFIIIRSYILVDALEALSKARNLDMKEYLNKLIEEGNKLENIDLTKEQ